MWITSGACRGARRRRSAAGALSRVAQRSDVAADDGGDGDAAVRAFPRALADYRGTGCASDEEILSEWAGLGYYARARNLIACAREVAERGGFPTTAAELRKLPGLGAYTSAAIAAIAFGEKAPAVDTNVERVIARVLGLKSPHRSEIERRTARMMEEHRPGDIVQAMMDLGASDLPAEAAALRRMSARADCAASRSGQPEAFPRGRAQGAATSLRNRLVDRARRPRMAGPAPAERAARRNGRASRQRVDDKPPPRPRRSAPSATCSLISRSTSPSSSHRAGRRRLVATDRAARRGGAAHPLPPRGGACAGEHPEAPRRRLKKPELPLRSPQIFLHSPR